MVVGIRILLIERRVYVELRNLLIMWYKVCCFLFKKKVIEVRGCEVIGIIVVYEVIIIFKVVNFLNVLR